MRFVTARDFKTNSSRIWKTLNSEKTMTVTLNGKPVAILLATSPENYEDSLDILRRIKAEKAVLSMQEHALETGLDKLSPVEIDSEIKATRQEKRK